MELKDILSISGQPGLFKFIAQGKNGIIVEALADGKRSNIPATSKVSSMGEISVYTEGEDLPLYEIFQRIFEKRNGGEAINPKSTPDQLKSFMKEIVPEYDQDRVHVSDMKKLVSWYNILVGAGMTDFSVEEPEKDTEDQAGAEEEKQ